MYQQSELSCLSPSYRTSITESLLNRNVVLTKSDLIEIPCCRNPFYITEGILGHLAEIYLFIYFQFALLIYRYSFSFILIYIFYSFDLILVLK